MMDRYEPKLDTPNKLMRGYPALHSIKIPAPVENLNSATQTQYVA